MMTMPTPWGILNPICKSLAILSMTMWLGGCANKNKVIIQGDKVPLDGLDVRPHVKALTKKDLAAPHTVVTQWSQHGFNAQHHTGCLQGMAKAWHPQWSRVIGGQTITQSRDPMLMTPSPVTSQSLIFILDPSGCVNAIDVKGSIVWKTPIQSIRDLMGMGGGLVVDERYVYVVTAQPNICALDIKTGKILWKRRLSQPIRSGLCFDHGNDDKQSSNANLNKRLYGLNVYNNLMAFDTASGRALWTEQGAPDQYRTMRSTVPALWGNNVVVGSYGGDILCLDACNGSLKWEHNISDTGSHEDGAAAGGIVAPPVITNQRVLSTSENGALVCLDLESGGLLWSSPIGSSFSPVVVGNTVIVVTVDGRCVGLDFTTGAIFWDKTLPGSSHWLGPIVMDDMVYILSQNGDFIRLDPYHPDKIQNLFTLNETYHNPPILFQDGFLFYSPKGRLTWYGPMARSAAGVVSKQTARPAATASSSP